MIAVLTILSKGYDHLPNIDQKLDHVSRQVDEADISRRSTIRTI